MFTEIPFEWFMLLLRILLIFLLYFFVFQVIRVISRELRVAASRQTQTRSRWDELHGSLRVSNPGDSQLHPGETVTLDPVTVIGRNRRATVYVDSSFVSAEHTQVSWDQGYWWVTDLQSTNGTYVNSYKIDGPTALSPGDHLEIGGVTFQLVP